MGPSAGDIRVDARPPRVSGDDEAEGVAGNATPEPRLSAAILQ